MAKNTHLFNSQKVIVYILLLIVGIGIGVLISKYLLKSEVQSYTQIRQSEYKYINPIVDIEPINEASKGELLVLQQSLDEIVREKRNNKETSDVTEVSIYYKDLNSGAWIGVNEKSNFTPASLLKVPIMISLYKRAEDNPSVLEEKLIYEPVDKDTEQNIKPEVELKSGEYYTVDDLIAHMITYSDNNASYALEEVLTDEEFFKIFSDLGLGSIQDITTTEDYMSVKEYAGFFRILYNASYLNKEYSMKALELLTQTTFNDGIVSGVPEGIEIAHKFGERTLDNTYVKQLHDCGIVYHPQKPYILCVMTRGTNFRDMKAILKQISSTVYSAVDKH